MFIDILAQSLIFNNKLYCIFS